MKGFFLGIVGAMVVAGVALVLLASMETPRPSCADGAISVSKTAEDAFNSKWSAFDAALNRGGEATVTLTEEEVTSRAVRYLADNGFSAGDVQVHLCPGNGAGQAAMRAQIAGRDVQAVVTGHLDLAASRRSIVVDSLQIGQVPQQIATPLANRLIELVAITVPSSIKGATSTSTSITIRGQK